MAIYENEETGEMVRTGVWRSNREQYLGRLGKRSRAWEAALDDLDWSKCSPWMVTLTYRPGVAVRLGRPWKVRSLASFWW